MGKNTMAKRLARVENTLKKDKPETKTLDVLITPTGTGVQNVFQTGINTGSAAAPIWSNYDLTAGFLQGLLNDEGNIDGNYCKLLSMDLRVLLQNPEGGVPPPPNPAYRKLRMMIVRIPAASGLTPVGVQRDVLEYGSPTVYGEVANVSPLKRNTSINGGYDVMYDRVHILASANTGFAPQKATKYIHFRKKWKSGLTLRFSSSAATLELEQNAIYLFCMDADNAWVDSDSIAANISFVNRIRYSDE